MYREFLTKLLLCSLFPIPDSRFPTPDSRFPDPLFPDPLFPFPFSLKTNFVNPS
ncbi:MAG: hypothetical protein F6K56_42680 [Moorea sp. SIO3G5]|nr:hypothetical protein [Moorena sp. SIO3G5]